MILARIVRTFETETPSGSTRQTVAKVLELPSVPRRNDRVALPDKPDDPVHVDRAVFAASEPAAASLLADRKPRVTLFLAPEPAEQLAAVLAAGWKAL
jgi:hypothetical protein